MKKFENAVIDALNRGVMVDLYTSAKRDQPVYRYMKNQSLMKNLINNGCKVYEIHEKLLHMKAYEIDNKHYSIGSFNNDRWSWKINNEANINIYTLSFYIVYSFSRYKYSNIIATNFNDNIFF